MAWHVGPLLEGNMFARWLAWELSIVKRKASCTDLFWGLVCVVRYCSVYTSCVISSFRSRGSIPESIFG